MARSLSKPVLFICLAVLIDSLGIGIIMPVMPDLIEQLTNLSLSKAALWGGYLTFSYALMQFIFSPVVGALSDRFGRRPVLLVSLFALGVDYVFMGIAPTIWLLFVGRIVAGIAGSTFSTAFAYLADVSSPQKRAQNFGLIGAAFGLGFILGPVIGGLAGEISVRAPFYVAAAISFANFVFGYLVLPESLPLEKQRAFSLKRANPFGAFFQVSKLPQVGWMVLAYFLFELGHYVYPVIWSFFAKEAFGWGAWEIGMSLAAVGVGFTFVQGWLIRFILPRLGNAGTTLAGFLFSIAGMIAISMVTQGWMVFALIPLTTLGAMVTPALKALIANLVDDDAQGELQGVLASSSAITMIMTPLIMTGLFSWFTGENALFYFPGAPFILAAMFIALAIVPMYIGLRLTTQSA